MKPEDPPAPPPQMPEDPPEALPVALPESLPSDRYLAQGGVGLSLSALAFNSQAEAELWQRLDGQDGWPADSAIHFPILFSEQFPAQFPGGPPELDAYEVILVDMTGDTEAIALDIELLPEGLRATPRSDLIAGRTYVYALLSDVVVAHDDHAPEAGWIDAIVAAGGVPERIALVDRFTISAQPTPLFDLKQGRMEIPNDLLRTVDGRLPADLDVAADHAPAIAQYDGFSTTAAIHVGFTGSVENIDARILEAEGRSVPLSTFQLDTNVIGAQPALPLSPGQLHAVAITTSDAQPNLQSLALILGSPITEQGRSSIRILDGSLASRLEPARLSLSGVRGSLGPDAQALTLLFPFTTLTAETEVLDRSAQLQRENVSTDPMDIQISSPGPLGLGLSMPSVELVVSGKIASLGVPEIDFILTIPKRDAPNGPIPVVLTGHGLTSSSEAVNTWAENLSAAGFAAFAIDLPYHGGRSSGLPILSSIDFINLEDLIATRDNFLSAMIDLHQAVRVIQQADWPALIGSALDGQDIVFMGTSLGGILGAGLSGFEPSISSYALNVPGANLVELISQSQQAILQNMLADDLARRGIEPGTPAYHRYIASAKWTMDPCDPINLIQRPQGTARYLIQMVDDDQVIPNSTTLQLAEISGTPVERFEPPLLGHAFLANPISPEGQRAQAQIIDFFSGR